MRKGKGQKTYFPIGGTAFTASTNNLIVRISGRDLAKREAGRCNPWKGALLLRTKSDSVGKKGDTETGVPMDRCLQSRSEMWFTTSCVLDSL